MTPKMTRLVAILAVLVLTLPLWSGKEYPAQPGESVVPNELLVAYRPGTALALVAAAAQGFQVQALSHIPDVYLIRYPAGTSPTYSTQLSQNPLVAYVEPNRIRHATLQPPNDLYFSAQWDLSVIQAQAAWQLVPDLYLTAGTASLGRIKVAVIDSGADCTHPDFANAGGSSPDA